MGGIAKRRSFSILILVFALTWLAPNAHAADIPTLSGVSQASNKLSRLLGNGFQPSSKNLGQLLSLMKSGSITGAGATAAIKAVLKLTSGDAKAAADHLTRLDSDLKQLKNAVKKAESTLQTTTGPSLNELANDQTRCQTIEQLRSIGEAFEAVRQLPEVLSAAEQRARSLKLLFGRLSRAYLDLLDKEIVAAGFFKKTGYGFINAETDHNNASRLEDRAKKLRKYVVALSDGLKQRHSRFDSNMKTFVEPLAPSSCSLDMRDKLRLTSESFYDEVLSAHELNMKRYRAKIAEIHQEETSAAAARKQRIAREQREQEAEREWRAWYAAAEAKRKRLREEYARARQTQQSNLNATISGFLSLAGSAVSIYNSRRGGRIGRIDSKPRRRAPAKRRAPGGGHGGCAGNEGEAINC